MIEQIEWVPVAERLPDDDEPMCTAFVPAGEPIPPPKDDRTADLFGSDAA